MTFTSRGIRAGIEKFKMRSGRELGDRDKLGAAIARLGLEPDVAINATNEIHVAKDKYKCAVRLLGVMRADKIRHVL